MRSPLPKSGAVPAPLHPDIQFLSLYQERDLDSRKNASVGIAVVLRGFSENYTRRTNGAFARVSGVPGF